ncbi:MAG: hypothetical protein JNM22_05600 [Saprospiraceae bacterium]|nr:hypothetical protein [Saprospiraceae bacterium]
MWSIQLPTGDFLESVPALSFELNNQIFSTDDNSILPGSFAFPVDIPLSPRNQVLLDHPHLVNNSRAFSKYEGCWIYAHGVPLFQADLRITNATPSKVKISLTANPIGNLKDKKLRDLGLGEERSIGDSTAMLAHAKATTTAPVDYDYVFFPILNDGYLSNGYIDDRARFQNYWNLSTDQFEVDHDYPAFMPFIRLEYLLEQMFAPLAFTFNNRFQTTDELRRLCLYNGTSMWTRSGLPTTIDLRRHVPDRLATAELKDILQNFALGVFTNIFSRTISIVPLRDLLTQPPKRDWTAYRVGAETIESRDVFPDNVYYRIPEEDAMFAKYPERTLPPNFYQGELDTLDELDDIGLAAGSYFIRARHAYYYALNPGASPYVLIYLYLGWAPGQGSTRLELPMPPLFDNHPSIVSGVTTEPWGSPIPWCNMPGTVEYIDPDGNVISQSNTPSERMLWYRGMYINTLMGGDYPQASAAPFGNTAEEADTLIDTLSLHMDGERGIYNQYWKQWHQMLRYGKSTIQQFSIPVSELVQFSFEEKIRAGSMDYFVKKIKIKQLLSNHLVLVEANLVSTI